MGKAYLESSFREKLRDAAKEQSNLYWWPIENKATKRTPDQHFINFNRVSGWVELKTVDSMSSHVKFQNGQVKWNTQYSSVGGVCWIAVEYVGGLVLFKGSDAGKLEVCKLGEVKPHRHWRQSRVKNAEGLIKYISELELKAI